MYLRAKLPNKLMLVPVLLLGLLSNSAWAGEAQRWQTNMTPGVTELSREVYDLHMLIFWICVWAGIGVFGFMFYSLIAYRKSKGHKPAAFHENTTAELAWTIVPTIILIAMAVPASKTLIELNDTSDAELDVLVTGYQWRWRYEYLMDDGEKVAFFSSLRTPREEIENSQAKGEHYLLEVDNPLILPVNVKTRLLLTANDVIHSWWVPAFAVKKDTVPGFINETWVTPAETGIFRGQCTELCGRDHGFMPIVVNVVEQDEFDAWFAGQQQEAAEFAKVYGETKDMAELYELGEQVHKRSCAACHGAQGEGGVGKAIAGSPYATGEVQDMLNVVVKGVPGTAMQAFGTQLNDLELAAVVTYQRNAFGNNMGDAVQAIDVKNFKEGN